MKTCRSAATLLFAFLLMATISIAQPSGKYEEWGKVSIDEMKMPSCSFEKNADAMMLLDLGEMFFSTDNPNFYSIDGKFKITTAYYKRYKVFSEKGSDLAEFKLTYTNGGVENIKNIRAYSYNLVDGQIQKTELKPSDIHTTETDASHTQLSFSVPAVSPGSVFEVGYQREQVVTYTLPTWTFTKSIPCAKSRLTIGFVDALIYYENHHLLRDSIEHSSVAFLSTINVPTRYSNINLLTGSAVTYTLRDLHSFQPDAHTNSPRNYTEWIEFQLYSFSRPLDPEIPVVHTFEAFVKHMYDDFNFRTNKEGPGIPKKEWKPLIEDNMTDEQKARVLFEFVRSQVKWNGYTGISPSKSNADIWKDKTGSYTEINMLLVNTLRQAGLRANPMLINTRHNGYTKKSYPIFEQYHAVDAFLELDGGKEFVLDATEQYIPFGVPAYDQLNTVGLVMKTADYFFWRDIQDKAGDRTLVSVTGDMDATGQVTGEIRISNNTYTAQDLLYYKNHNENQEYSDWLKKQVANITMESVKDSQDLANCRFLSKIKFTAQAVTDNDGAIYFSVPTIYGSATNPYINRERSSDVDLGHKSRQDVVMQIRLPEGYTVDS